MFGTVTSFIILVILFAFYLSVYLPQNYVIIYMPNFKMANDNPFFDLIAHVHEYFRGFKGIRLHCTYNSFF